MSLKLGLLAAATVATGLTAGVFGLYAHTIMRGLGETDDRTFVGAFQAIDRAIINPLWLATFFGALVLSVLAAVLYLRDGGGGSVRPWLIVACVLYAVVVVMTMAVHVPLNDDIKAAGDPDRIADLASVRDAFHETRWVVWNIVRAVLNTVAFVCLAWTLVIAGRADADTSVGAASADTSAADAGRDARQGVGRDRG